jgi:4-amino-4-deoxy-L-arabinose transferase-like glycosyltransferase
VKKLSIIFISIIVTVIFSFMVSTWGLTETSEARYAEISKEMYTSGDYLYPELLGIHHFHKPPLTYYITALGYAIFGINERGTRFFLMIALLLQCWLVYKISLRFYKHQETAVVAALIYFSYPIVQAACKNLTTDAYLTSFILASIYSFILYRQRQQALYGYLFYFFCALAFLTKGPVGLLPQVLFAIGYSRSFPSVGRTSLHQYLAILFGIVLCCSWFVLLLINNPSLYTYFVKHQLADRVASNSFDRTQPWWYYIVTIPLLGLPAFIYFIDYIFTAKGHFKNPAIPSRFIIASLVIGLLVFSISASKLVLYVLPLYLFIAMLSAAYLVHISTKRRRVLEVIAFVYSLLFSTALAASTFIQLPVYIPLLPVLPLATGAMLASIFIYYTNWTMPAINAPLLNALPMILVLLAVPFIMKKNEAGINSIKPVATFINTQLVNKKDPVIAVYDYLLPSLAFYTNKKLVTINNGNGNTNREIQFEQPGSEAQHNYIRLAGLAGDDQKKLLTPWSFDCIVARKDNDIPDSLIFLKRNLLYKATAGKWIIYY